MDDSVDKQLVDHVRQTLDGYQTPYQLGAWEQFEQARQPANRRLGAWYRYGVAASVLGGTLLAPLWLNDAPIPSSITTGLVANQPTQLVKAFTPKEQFSLLPSVSTFSSEKQIVGISECRTQKQSTRTDSRVNSVADKNPPNSSSRIALYRTAIETKGADLVGRSGEDGLSATHSSTPTASKATMDSNTSKPDQPLTTPLINTPTTIQTTLVSVATALAMTETTRPDKQIKPHRTVTWGLALAPQTAYIPNGRSSLTVGGGIVSDIALSRRLSVSTGLSIAQQTVGTAPPVNQVMTTTGRQFTGTNARFVFIDLPLNLTYQVGKRTKPLFRISAGLSSLAFLNQQYADTYQTLQTMAMQVIDQNGRPQIIQQTTQTEEVQTRPTTAFGGVYWGRLLNLSVGIERPLSRRTIFAIEPYLKYPLGPLTQENLSIRSAGISLRVSIR